MTNAEIDGTAQQMASVYGIPLSDAYAMLPAKRTEKEERAERRRLYLEAQFAEKEAGR